MGAVELKQTIAEYLSNIDDISFLNALKTIVESKASDGIYKLSDVHKERISLAREELTNGLTLTHSEVQNEINQWLNAK